MAWTEGIKKGMGGAVGAGLVLVVAPSIALYFGGAGIAEDPTVGLPILAIFGIMILFGSVALTSTLFARLGLQDKTQALALPEGSIRAAIALALIVLFAIISIMLFQSMSRPLIREGLSQAEKDIVVRENEGRLIAVIPEKCVPRSPTGPPRVTEPAGDVEAGTESALCTPGTEPRYSVHMYVPPNADSADMAKQMLVLIGTLMTSVTSYYFASRTAAGPKPPPEGDDNDASTSGNGGLSESDRDGTDRSQSLTATEEQMDGCEVPIGEATPDDELPAATGGVS